VFRSFIIKNDTLVENQIEQGKKKNYIMVIRIKSNNLVILSSYLGLFVPPILPVIYRCGATRELYAYSTRLS